MIKEIKFRNNRLRGKLSIFKERLSERDKNFRVEDNKESED